MFRSGRIALASALAGPSVVFTTGLASLYLQLPAPITVAPEAVFGMIGIAFIAALFGMVVAVPVNAIGAAAMLALGELYAPARTRTAWMLVGGVIGGIAAWLMAAPPELEFALIATSALCGRLCNAGDAEAQSD